MIGLIASLTASLSPLPKPPPHRGIMRFISVLDHKPAELEEVQIKIIGDEIWETTGILRNGLWCFKNESELKGKPFVSFHPLPNQEEIRAWKKL